MRLAFQILFALLGLSSLYVGIVNFYLGSEVLQQFFQIDISELSNNSKHVIDIQIRILSGVWISAGIYSLIILRQFEDNTNIIRLILIGFGISALGELYSVLLHSDDISMAIIKATMQVGFCIFMEFLRHYIVSKLPNQISQHDIEKIKSSL